MSQFLVPQFIDVEPKIIGPITVRQFLVVIVGLMLVFIEYKLLDFITFIIVGLITLVIFGILAFLKVNGQPFHYFLLNLGQTLRRPPLRLWRKEVTTAELKEFLKPAADAAPKETFHRKALMESSHLDELSLIVNTGGAYESTDEEILAYEKHKK